jgi:hypothetical protein
MAIGFQIASSTVWDLYNTVQGSETHTVLYKIFHILKDGLEAYVIECFSSFVGQYKVYCVKKTFYKSRM